MNKAWYSMTAEETAAELSSNGAAGLSTADAAERLKQ